MAIDSPDLTTAIFGGIGTLVGTGVTILGIRSRTKVQEDTLQDIKVPQVLMQLVDTLRDELDRVHHMRANEKTVWIDKLSRLEERQSLMEDQIRDLTLENVQLRNKIDLLEKENDILKRNNGS